MNRPPMISSNKEDDFFDKLKTVIVQALIQKQPPKVFYRKIYLKNSQNLQENPCTRVSFLIKLQVSACNFIKKETGAGVFLWILRKFLEQPFSRTPCWLLL